MELKRERNAVILAHNYQAPEVQDIADFTGDSLELARKATEIDADTIVFCTIAFYGVITGGEFLNYVIVGYFYKVLLEVVLLPITYRVIAVVKKHEPTYGEPESVTAVPAS